ncbi:hypothetical protein [Olivibacter sp. XZL3]|uniref:hypothetical protein n=1 Tax=Olivibacter sp. XZL3 TaxID=1735116 RepID=UPI001064F2E4|nr:hypothetical protein [Olivibacter sp. XZL3]
MKKFLFASLCICSVIMACNKDNSSNPATSLNTQVTLSYATMDGKDLLDPGTPNHINYQNTDLYYKNGDREVKQFHGNLDLPKMFKIAEDEEGKYRLTVFMNSDVQNGELSSNILKYEHFKPDTIETSIVRNGNNVSYTDLAINGKPISSEDLKGFVLIK